MTNRIHAQGGFALLMTLIVVGVVLSVGLAILDLSIKQANLSTNAKESEIAFHAANAGLECAYYWRRHHRDDIRNGNDIDIDCFGASANNVSADASPPGVVNASGADEVFVYEYDLTWGTTPDERCTRVTMLTMFGDVFGNAASPLTVNLQAVFPQHNAASNKECAPGEQCTVIGLQGYNTTCANINSFGAVQRQVLLEF